MKRTRRYGNYAHCRGEDAIDRLAARAGIARGRRPFHERLSEGVERAIRQGRRGRACLRTRVFELTRRAEAAGLSREDVRSALVEFLSDHPVCDRLDRVCLTDSRRVSDHLTEQVERWIAAAVRQ